MKLALSDSGQSLLPTIGAFVLVTLFALGGGYLMGSVLVDRVHTKLIEDRQVENVGAANPIYVSGSKILKLDPIVTNLLSSSDNWVRIESSLVLRKNDEAPNPEEDAVLAKEIAQDLLLYARTLGPRQLEGTRGLLRLRDDLNERARIRGGDRVRELVLGSVVIQ